MAADPFKNLADRAADAVRLCELRCIPKFVGFLSPEEAAWLRQKFRARSVAFFGGAPDCERTVFGALPDYITDLAQAFPITLLCFEYPAAYRLSHRDVLGALMAKGIVRAGVGDIIISEGRAFVFVLEELSGYLLQQTDKIGNVGVHPRVANPAELEQLQSSAERRPITFTVSSPRLDAVLSGLTHLSRSRCEALIEEGKVRVNAFTETRAIKKIAAGDTVAVRGIGKFKINQTGAFTRKGKERILAEQYL